MRFPFVFGISLQTLGNGGAVPNLASLKEQLWPTVGYGKTDQVGPVGKFPFVRP